MDYTLKIKDPSDLFGRRKSPEPNSTGEDTTYEIDQFGGIALGPTVVVCDAEGKEIDNATLKLTSKGVLTLARRGRKKVERKPRVKKKSENTGVEVSGK